MRWACAVVLLAINGCATAQVAIRVTSAATDGPGTLRAAIHQANTEEQPRRILSELPRGTVVSVDVELPALRRRGILFDAAGLRLAPEDCYRPSGKRGCSGLVVSGRDITVKDLVSTGFMFDGIAVRGAAARDVRILGCRASANLDDGIGISDHARGVVVEGCELRGNGFRTKGKGILVFDYAEAVLRHNTVRFNRDGITISRRSRAALVGNRIEQNYDKGFGVAGAWAVGRDNIIARNGLGGDQYETPPPNGDGVRITIDSEVELDDCVIEGNGDSGVVVIGAARLLLRGGRIAGNGGVGIGVDGHGVAELRGVSVYGNRGGRSARRGEGLLLGLR